MIHSPWERTERVGLPALIDIPCGGRPLASRAAMQ
jgi:hypothetical protein